MLNSVLSSSARKVMSNPAPAQFMITARFFNSDSNSTFNFFPLKIGQIKINRDYLENYGDEIDLTMPISPKDYALLQDQGQNLLCVLTLTYVTKDGTRIFDPAPIQQQYHVMINDPRDVRKAVPDIQVYTEPSHTITVRLVEPAIYKLRHKRINTIFQNATVTQAIYAITQKFDISSIEMVTANNTHQYDHIDIPSYQGIDAVYSYLHSKFGIYEKGSTSYITGGVLYVYPPFETNPSYDRTVIFYQVDNGSYAGSHIFHKVENNTVSIVINEQPESYDLSVAGSENIGTGFVFTRASKALDGYATVSDGDKAEYTENPALSISLDTSRAAVKGSNNIRHVKTTDNPYPDMSEIISHQASLMQVNWMNADPFLLDPGHAVSYYYDENQKMVRKSGILEHATFVLSEMERSGPKSIYGAVGLLTLRLSPNSTQVL